MNNREIQFKLTTNEAIEFINIRKENEFNFFLNIRIDTPHKSGDAFFLKSCTSYLSVTKEQALSLVKRLLPKQLEEKGARIPISVIGTDYNKKYAVWIG